MTQSELIDWLVNAMGICGCSEEDNAVLFLQDLLEVAEMRTAGLWEEANTTLDDILPSGDCLERNLAIYWINASGLTEHGDRLDTFTLSDIGEDVLEALRTYGPGDQVWERETPLMVEVGDGPDRSLN